MNFIRAKGIAGKETGGPLLLLLSSRDRIRDILTIGLVQCNYQVLQADSSFIATVKASQFLPELVIVDITANNTKDIILIRRLRNSIRTRKIAVLIIVPAACRQLLDHTLAQQQAPKSDDTDPPPQILEYPFNFAELLKRVKTILSTTLSTGGAAALPAETPDHDYIARRLFDLQVPIDAKLRDVEASIHRQWAFPFTVVKALDIIDSDESCCTELAKFIATDMGATSAILKVANTINYAKRGGKHISDIKEAVIRLGFRETRNLLACLALIDLSSRQFEEYGFSRDEFWLHSLATALIAERLCIESGYRRPELAFVAGLIHDLGKIPIDNNFNDVFARLLEETAHNVKPFYAAEMDLMGFSHATLGHFLTSMWNFPATISMAILCHHDPARILSAATPLDRIVFEAVFCANQFAKALNIGHSCDEILDDIPEEMFSDLRIGVQGLSDRFIAGIYRNLSSMCKTLNITSKNLFMNQQRPETAGCEIVVVLNKRLSFHPLILALRNAGFTVRVTNQFSADLHASAKIVISISEKGPPLDIVLYEDDSRQKTENAGVLKIFVLD
ncbi:MAG: response regulator, partial [Chitinivibrionales bacterium]|nr:response regulator [Chitinivibrionales bacterium]